ALISGNSTSDIDPRPGCPALAPVPVSASIHPCSGDPLPSVLVSFGLTTITAETIADALGLAVRCGVAVVVQGTGCSELARVLSAAISKTSYRSVEVGLG